MQKSIKIWQDLIYIICIAANSTELTTEALRCGSHCKHTTPTFTRRLSPEGASSSDNSYLITAYCSFIDPERVEG